MHGPERIGVANIVVADANRCSRSPSAVSAARSAAVITTPPDGAR